MSELRCAQCGASTSDDSLDFPFCSGCRENLLKCRYCLFFEEEKDGCRHPEARGRFQANADSVPACPYHRSRLVPPVLTRAVPPVLWVLGLGGLVFLFMFALRASLGPPASSPSVERMWVEAEGPERCIVGQPDTFVKLMVRNEQTEVSEPIAFQLPVDFFARFRVDDIVPDPVRKETKGSKVCLHYPPLQAGQPLTVLLYVTPLRPGISNLKVWLVSGDNIPLEANVPLRTDPVRAGR